MCAIIECRWKKATLLLACAITHQSHVQGTVLEPCPRLNVQVNESLDPLRGAVDGTASTSDVFCRLFGTTITTVPSAACLLQIYRPQSVACLVGSRLVGIGPPTPCPLFDGVGMYLCSLVVVDAHDSAHLVCVQCFTVSCEATLNVVDSLN